MSQSPAGAKETAPTRVVPEMYGPNTDIGVYLQDNLGSLLPKRARASTWSNLVDDLERVLRKVKPAVIVAPHPQLDTHRDHQFTMVALAQRMCCYAVSHTRVANENTKRNGSKVWRQGMTACWGKNLPAVSSM